MTAGTLRPVSDGAPGPAGHVHAVYQPIVDLDTREVVGYEALARGSAPPDELFRAARDGDWLAELDWSCRAAGVSGALEADLARPLSLFLNVEPETLGTECPPHLTSLFADAERQQLRVVMEITERALTRDPAALLAAVAAARRRGWGIALDDVGADPASLALMPFLNPDVIKLDLRLVQEHTTGEIAGIVNAVLAQAERSGASILAEGIETEDHLRRALAMGARLGQGWLFGRPTTLPPTVCPTVGVPFVAHRSDLAVTPFEGLPSSTSLRIATKDLLLPMSHHLEHQALRAPEPPVLLGAFEHVRHFTSGTAERYRRLAEKCSLVGALGAGMGPEPVPGDPGVRGADLAPDDVLRGEWVVAVVGPHFAGALIAKDLQDDGPDRERRFLFTITYDRSQVIRSANSLLGRVIPGL